MAVTGEGARRHDAPMIGRTRELDRLRDAFEQAAESHVCQLFTILGAAGVGKSRLAAEFLGGVDACAVRGRFLSYGDGITYWPVVEALKQLETLPSDPIAPPRCDRCSARAIVSVTGLPESVFSPISR